MLGDDIAFWHRVWWSGELDGGLFGAWLIGMECHHGVSLEEI